MMTKQWLFDVAPEATVVTTAYVTRHGMPVLSVSHELDEEEGVIWQFHCGNGDFSGSVLQLVRLEEILRLDASLAELARLPIGHSATRLEIGGAWEITREEC